MTPELLKTAAMIGNVKTVAIVDDAYDPPKPAEISQNAFNLFFRSATANENILAELSNSCGLTTADIDDWEEFIDKTEKIQALWAIFVGACLDFEFSSNTHDALKCLFEDVKLDRQSKLSQLSPLENLLKSIDARIIRLGSDPDPKTVAKTDIVFLDLYLSENIPAELKTGEQVPRSMYEHARDRAIDYLKNVREVTSKELSAITPAFILISTQGSDQKAENFRKRAGQMASRFRFVSKQNLRNNRPQELLAISDIFRTCGACSIIEPIQKAWPAIMDETSKWINTKLLELDIPDFGFLYNQQLKKEGQPIADYIKEIIAAAFAERICYAFSELKLPRQDEKRFEGVDFYFDVPSNGFVELYETGRISHDLGYRGSSKYDPQAGDIFLSGHLPKNKRTSLIGRKVLSVMSPSCDLIDRSGKGMRAKSVLLLEGTVHASTYNRQNNEEPQITCINGKYYEIQWHLKKPEAMSVDDLRKQWKEDQITWLGRLKGEHFLSLQSEYLNDLGRVGLSKTPSVYERLAGRVSYKDGKNRVVLEEFKGEKEFAYLHVDGEKGFDKQPIVFSGKFINHLFELFTEAPNKATIGANARAKLTELNSKLDNLVALTERKTAPSHSNVMQNNLKVELHPSADHVLHDNNVGVMIISVWPDI